MSLILDRIASRATGARVSKPVPAKRIPLVSVVVPCYNYGHFLPTCLASVLDQPDVAVQVIVIDDASPDGSGEVADRLAADDFRVEVVRHESNTGHIATYNEGIEHARRGDYIVLLSADDSLTTGSLGRAVGLLEANRSVGFVYGPSLTFSSEVRPKAVSY